MAGPAPRGPVVFPAASLLAMTQDDAPTTYGEPAMPLDPGQEPVDGVPPDIAEAVQMVENRYGERGLEQLIEAAQGELANARRALEALAEPGDQPGA